MRSIMGLILAIALTVSVGCAPPAQDAGCNCVETKQCGCENCDCELKPPVIETGQQVDDDDIDMLLMPNGSGGLTPMFF